MNRSFYPLLNGKFLEVKEPERTAFKQIENRFQRYMPIECVDLEEVLKLINQLRVMPNRDLSPKEVLQLVDQLKEMLTNKINQLPKHKRYLNERGEQNDQKGT